MSDILSDAGKKVKELAGTADSFTRLKQKSKLEASYIEYDKFADSNLHEGYFCYNCIYWSSVSGGRCVLVDSDGPDVRGKVSDVIAPHGCCQAYDPNYGKLHDTREPGSSPVQDTDKNLKKTTSADVT